MRLLVMQFSSPHMGPLHSSLSELDAERHRATALFSGVIAEQKKVIKFITNHHATLGIFRELAEKELLKTGASRMPCSCT
jgi:hypothetical protein